MCCVRMCVLCVCTSVLLCWHITVKSHDAFFVWLKAVTLSFALHVIPLRSISDEEPGRLQTRIAIYGSKLTLDKRFSIPIVHTLTRAFTALYETFDFWMERRENSFTLPTSVNVKSLLVVMLRIAVSLQAVVAQWKTIISIEWISPVMEPDLLLKQLVILPSSQL